MNYPGESIGKKIARARAYAWARYALPRRECSVLALCGPTAADIGLIQAYRITDDPSMVTLIDVDDAGLAVARQRWPGVKTFHGQAGEYVGTQAVDLAVMDFCGLLEGRDNLSALTALRGRLRLGSVVCLTYTRAHETRGSVTSTAMRYVKGFEDEDIGYIHNGRPGRVRDAVRAAYMAGARAGASMAVLAGAIGLPYVRRKGLKEGEMVVLYGGSIGYIGAGKTPMGMTMARIGKAYELYRGPRIRPIASGGSWICGDSSALSATKWADKIAAAGFDAAKALNVKPGTLAAWRAHRTMGTYAAAS